MRCGCPVHGDEGCQNEPDSRGRCHRCYSGACFSKGIPYKEFRLLVVAARTHARQQSFSLLERGYGLSYSEFLSSIFREGACYMNKRQHELLEAEYEATFAAERLHNIRNRQRLERGSE